MSTAPRTHSKTPFPNYAGMNGSAQPSASPVFDARVWLYPPPDAITIHKPGVVTIPAAGTSATVVQVVVPNGKNAVIWLVANAFVGGAFIDGNGSVTWQLFRDPAFTRAVRGFNNILSSLGTPEFPGKLSAPIRFFENEVITLRVTNNTLVLPTQLSTGLLGGWFYDKRHEVPGAYL